MDAEPEWKDLVNRSAAAVLIGMTRSGLRYLDGVELTPITVGKRVYYRRRELDAVLYRRLEDGGRKAFRIFEAGGGPVQLVTDHGIDPVSAERLWETWQRLKQAGGRTLVIELPHDIRSTPWCRAHGFDPEEGVPPLWALRAIELVARSPAQRERIDRLIGRRTEADLDG